MLITPHETHEDEARYRRLDTIDTKCGSLMAVTSILLVFVSLPPIFDQVRPHHPLLLKLVFVALLASCLITLLMLFFKNQLSDRFVTFRMRALNCAVALTGACCVVVAYIIAAKL